MIYKIYSIESNNNESYSYSIKIYYIEIHFIIFYTALDFILIEYIVL